MRKNIPFVAIGLIITALSIGFLANITPASAQSSGGTGQALEIAPPVITLTADPGQSIDTKINLRNVSGGDLVVTGEINDFVANGEDGTPKILLDDKESSPYSIKSWISPLPELSLKSRQKADLPVTISVPANASPGGYYGVIRFTGTPPELKGTGVSLSASLGSLILLRVNGKVKESVSIAEFSVNQRAGKPSSIFETASSDKDPITFTARFQNNGNIHEQPVGQITITDMFGNKIAAPNINLQANNILPSSTRKFEQPLDYSIIGNKMLFGRYTAELKVTYGSDKTVLTKIITFWVIPYTLIGIIIILLIATFIGLRYAIIRYNRYIRNQVQYPKNKK